MYLCDINGCGTAKTISVIGVPKNISRLIMMVTMIFGM
jgi:hypothetical protein